jgi:hypothetical protein
VAAEAAASAPPPPFFFFFRFPYGGLGVTILTLNGLGTGIQDRKIWDHDLTPELRGTIKNGAERRNVSRPFLISISM